MDICAVAKFAPLFNFFLLQKMVAMQATRIAHEVKKKMRGQFRSRPIEPFLVSFAL